MFDRNKKWFAYTHWKTFAVYEGLVRIVNLSLLRVIAMYLLTPIASFMAVGIIGSVRAVGGLILTLRSGYALFPNARAVFGSMLTGLLVAYTTLVPLYAFLVADTTLLMFAALLALGFIPGILLSSWFARGRVSFFQVCGLLVGFGVLGCLVRNLTIDGVLGLPIILLISLPLAALAKDVIVTNLGTARTISPWVHNTWVGLAMLICAGTALLMFNSTILMQGAEIINMPVVILLSVIAGLLYLVTVLLRQKAFQDMGGVFSRKKIVIASAASVAAFIVDVLWVSNVTVFTVVFVLISIGALLLAAKR